MNAVAALPLPMPVKAVGFALAVFMRRDGQAWPSEAAVARAAGCSARTVRRSLRVLETAGLLVTERRAGAPSWYRTPDTLAAQVRTRWPDTPDRDGRVPRTHATGTPATVSAELDQELEDLTRAHTRAREAVQSETDEQFIERIQRERGYE